jgi:hypothetical protein
MEGPFNELFQIDTSTNIAVDENVSMGGIWLGCPFCKENIAAFSIVQVTNFQWPR